MRQTGTYRTDAGRTDAGARTREERVRRGHLALLLLLLFVPLTQGCLRRPLWIYTDEFRQVELITDWSGCPETPDGMTAWFSCDDLDGRNRRITTSEVTHTWLNLPHGQFTGIVFDWSPAEYGNQDFVGMSRPDSSYVRVHPSVSQPAPDEHLYGGYAVPAGMDIPLNAETGNHVLSAVPDPMCADTLRRVVVVTGVDGDLILWEERDGYSETLETVTLYAEPHPITWKLRTFVNLRGINYMYTVRGSIAGLADGNRLPLLRHTPEVCLHALDPWEISGRNTAQNTGSVASTIDTFGLPEAWAAWPEGVGESGTGGGAGADTALPPLRLNLQFLLRDEETVVNCHYDVPPEWISVFPDQRVIRIDIPIEFGPDLPYVDAKGSAGFDATVSPWEDGGSAEVGM